jgi:hypothetical protein
MVPVSASSTRNAACRVIVNPIRNREQNDFIILILLIRLSDKLFSLINQYGDGFGTKLKHL